MGSGGERGERVKGRGGGRKGPVFEKKKMKVNIFARVCVFKCIATLRESFFEYFNGMYVIIKIFSI